MSSLVIDDGSLEGRIDSSRERKKNEKGDKTSRGDGQGYID